MAAILLLEMCTYCRAEFQPGVKFNSLALKSWVEQRFSNNIMEPFNPRLVAEYVTKGVVAENYCVLVVVTWGYEMMRQPQPDCYQLNIAVTVITSSFAVSGKNSGPECGWKGLVLFDLSRRVGCSIVVC